MTAEQSPDEAAEFPGDGDFGLVALDSTGQQPVKAQMKAVLGFPTQSAHVWRLVLLAAREFLADFGRQQIMLGAFGEDPALMAVATTGDVAQPLAWAAGRFGGD